MAENVFNTIKVRIPRNMLVLKKNGKVARVRSMTDKGNIKRVNGKTSIILEDGDNVKPSFINEGRYRTLEDFKQYPLMSESINKISNFKQPKVIEHVEHLIDDEPSKGKLKKELIKSIAYAQPKPERLIKAEPDFKMSPIGSYVHKPIKMNVKPKMNLLPNEKGVEYGEMKLKPQKFKGTAEPPLYPFFESQPPSSSFIKKKKKK